MNWTMGPKGAMIEQVLRELDIVVGEAIHGNYVTRCPWPDNHSNGDQNPSFSINADTGQWICYRGCAGGGGSLERLVRLVLNLERGDAKRWLLSRGSSASLEDMYRSVGLLDPPEEGESPVSYQAFRLDYANTLKDVASDFILARGFTPDTLRKWGFRYDPRLRAVVIPIVNFEKTELVGIIRRMVPPIRSGFPKYLYSPGFDRSAHLFGAYRHRSDQDQVIVVEGPLDAVWLHQNGYTSAVALLGVYCSEAQERLLSKLGATVILALDNDSAGIEATWRLTKQLGGKFHVMYTSIIGGHKDVQDLSADELREVFGHPKHGWELE